MSDIDFLQNCIKKAISKGATCADGIIIDNSQLSIECRLSKLTHLERSKSKSIGIRVFINKKQAVVSSDNFSDNALEEIIHRAISMAKESLDDPFSDLATPDMLIKKIPELKLSDNKEITTNDLFDIANIAETSALKTNGITNSEGASASFSKNTITLATSNDFAYTYNTTFFSNSVSVIAEKDGHKETDYDVSYARHFSDLNDAQQIGKIAAEKCIKKIGSRKIGSAKIPVIFHADCATTFLKCLASAINGSSITKQTSFLKQYLDKQIFNKSINIIDDPLIVKGLASKPFDAEGIEGKKRLVVENGVLNSWLLDIRTANQLGMKTTGHAQRSTSSVPYAGPSNFYLSPGEQNLQELIHSIDYGLLITELFGNGINLVNGDYSQGLSGFVIEKGQISYPVSEITVAGNLLEMFKILVPANDLQFRYGINSPSIFIESVSIAGT